MTHDPVRKRAAALLDSGRGSAIALVVAIMLMSLPAKADTSFHLTSSVEEAGTYRYDLKVNWNGFFTNFYDVGISCEGVIDEKWLGTWVPGNTQSVIVHTNSPYTTLTTNVFILFLAHPTHIIGGTYISINIAGYWRAPALIPSNAEGQSTTATLHFASHVIMPDPGIQDITENTVTVSWPGNATIRIEATEDYNVWNPIATILQYPPLTTWTSGVPLESYGKAIRASIIAVKHLTNQVSSTVGLQAKNRTANDVNVNEIRSAPGGVLVSFSSQSGDTYTVELREFGSDQLVASATVVATGTVTTVVMDDLGSTIPLRIVVKN